jgi:hypothetical protein
MKFTANLLTTAFLSLGLGGTLFTPSYASDHDDGVADNKTQATNLTDLYAFREDWQTGSEEDEGNLILVMNSFPRALPETQYHFATDATYNFHLTRVPEANKNEIPTGNEDIRISFQFQEPNENNVQPFTMNITRDGETTSVTTTSDGQPLQTNPLNVNQEEEGEDQQNNLMTNIVSLDGQEAMVFAGLREDPFFFDVQQFFKVRAGAAGIGPQAEFKRPSQAEDFAHEYNVNSIVVRLPLSALEGAMAQQQEVPAPQPEGEEGEEQQDMKSLYDVWTTVFRGEAQVERLARPAINEGLIISNNNLNAFNSIMPNMDLSEAAAPVLEEAATTLNAFDEIDGNDDLTVEQVTTAFLPDVMRVDPNLDIEPGEMAYNHSVSGDKSMLTSGRKLKDDVIDITLSLLVSGDPSGEAVQDNVSYEGENGNPAQGHSPLYGAEDSDDDEATFPFLAEPN